MMKERFHPGPHLDADQLNAFAEGALNEREREESLAHLAECAECRSIVFLAQEPLPPAPAFEAVPFWRRWLGPLSLAGAALACGVVIVVAVQRQRASVPTRPTEIATETPQPLKPLQTPKTVEDKAARTAHAPVKPTSVVAGKAPKGAESFAAVSRSFMAAPPPSPPVISAGMVAGQVSSANQSVRLGAASGAGMAAGRGAAPQTLNYAAAPAASTKDREVVIHADAIHPLPVNGRDVARSALEKSAAAAPSGSLGLTIEHHAGTEGGLSEVTGLVRDAAGAMIPGATVTLRQMNGAAISKVVTGADGRFRVAALPEGRYSLQIASPGFEQLSRVIDLQPRDVATLDSTLQVGSVSATVTVSAAEAQLSGTEISAVDDAVRESPVQGGVHTLPSKLPEVLTAAKGKRLVAVDSAGGMFVSGNGGKHWKAVKAKWLGKVAQLALVSGGASAASGTQVFQLKTDAGAVWLSDDGAHWHLP